MPLQSDNLGMIGLSYFSSQPPPNTYQSQLLKGIHLRWAFSRELGFPWHGFYLFRRPAMAGSALCLSKVIGGLKAGTADDNKQYTALGLISSDKNLVLTENFAPGSQVEFDLDGRSKLRFDLPQGEPARRVVLSIGFRSQRCIDFKKIVPVSQPTAKIVATPVSTNPNPLNQQGVLFLVKGATGQAANTKIDSVKTSLGELKGLYCDYQVVITPPKPTNSVELLITKGQLDVTAKAFDDKNKVVASGVLTSASDQRRAPSDQTGIIKLVGANIKRIEVDTARNKAYLHRVCFDESFNFTGNVEVTAFSGDTPVRSVIVSGAANQVISQPIEFDSITAIEIGSGPAVLVDLCLVPVAQGATQGWEKLPRFTYPMGLPVTHSKYPCTLALGEQSVRQVVKSRMRTELPPSWDPTDTSSTTKSDSISQLLTQFVNLVEGGPGGTPMAEVVKEESAPPDVPKDKQQRLNFYPLDLVLIGALHPALAQAVGLYWIDDSFVPNVAAYDYLIVADHTGIGERNADKVLSTIKTSGFTQLDGYIVFNKSTAVNDPDLTPPSGLRAYALPGGAFPNAEGTMPAGINNAGLCWELGWSSTGGLLPDRPIMYLVWRSDMGNADKPGTATPYNLVTKLASGKPKPILVTEPRLPKDLTPQRALDWPPFPLHYIDRNLPEGWYSYQANGIDLFGRHSKNSTPSVWHQWQISVGDPVPWYYESPSQETNVKLVGSPPIRLLDKIPPPKPTGVEAYALDPKDLYLVKDQAYQNWYNNINPPTMRQTLIGLRVRWTWTKAHQRLAQDTREFRLYFNLGTDPPVTVPPEDRDRAVKWQERLHVVGYNESFSTIDPTNRTHGVIGTGSVKVTAASGYKWWAVSDSPWLAVTSGSSGSGNGTVYYNVYNNSGEPRTGTLKIAGHTFIVYQQDAASKLPASQPVSSKEDRVYEVFLSQATVPIPASLPMNPSPADPVVYAHIGVTAADDKQHTKDLRTTGSWGNRFGNEGRVGPPAKIYLVLRDNPDPPPLISDEDRVYASPADYRDHSYYTYRWLTPKKTDNLRLHLFRAMDDAIFKTDWLIRMTRFALDPENAQHKRFFPAGWVTPGKQEDLIRKKAAAKALNGIKLLTDYDQLSADAKELLVRLPGNDGSMTWNERKQHDWSLRQLRQNLTANDLKDLTGWDSTKCQVVATEFNTFILSGVAATVDSTSPPAILKLDGTSDLTRIRPYRDMVLLKSDTKSANRQYRIIAVDNIARTLTLDTLMPEDAPVLTGGTSAWMIPLYQTLSDGSLRALAILPENKNAFVQITIDPLDSYETDSTDTTKLRWRNRRGPDNSEDFSIDEEGATSAYIDTLDGRSTNRYLYRAAFVDGAHNLGVLGKAGPVVYLPNVVPPRAPVITKVLGGDRQITIKWASNREADLTEYRIYRAETEEATRDLRLMEMVHTESVSVGDPMSRPAELSWVNTPVPGLKKYYYRLCAIDDVRNRSELSPIVVGQAYDYGPPSEPIWEKSEWVKLDQADHEHPWSEKVVTLVPAIALVFTAAQENVSALVERYDGSWHSVTQWVRAAVYDEKHKVWRFTLYDRTAKPTKGQQYRIRLITNAGVSLVSTTERSVPMP